MKSILFTLMFCSALACVGLVIGLYSVTQGDALWTLCGFLICSIFLAMSVLALRVYFSLKLIMRRTWGPDR